MKKQNNIGKNLYLCFVFAIIICLFCGCDKLSETNNLKKMATSDMISFQDFVDESVLANEGFKNQPSELAKQLDQHLMSDIKFVVDGDVLTTETTDPWGTPYKCWNIPVESIFVFDEELTNSFYNISLLNFSEENKVEIVKSGIAIFSAGEDKTLQTEVSIINGETIFSCKNDNQNDFTDDFGVVILCVEKNGQNKIIKCPFGIDEDNAEEVHKLGQMATCTAPQTCLDCGKILAPALPHDWVQKNEAYVCKECRNCGKEEAHAFTTEILNEGSCTTGQKERYSCECGYYYSKSLGTQPHDLRTTKPAYCTTEGLLECRNCSYTETIPPKGHEGTIIYAGKANAHTWYSICECVVESEHTFTTEVITKGSCTTTRKEKYTCECGYYYSKGIGTVGHDMAYVKPALCTTEGLMKCKNCDYTESIPAKGHQGSIMYAGKANAHTWYSGCECIVSDEHTFTTEVISEGSCTTTRKEKYTCECGYYYSKSLGTIHCFIDGICFNCGVGKFN